MVMIMSHISLTLALLGYSLSAGLFLHAFPHANQRRSSYRWAFGLFVAATSLIVLALAISITDTYYSQTSGLMLIACMSLVTIIATIGMKIRLMGILVSPLASLMLMFLAYNYPDHPHIVGDQPPLLLEFHIFTAAVGQGFAIIAFGISCLYLFQRRALKFKKFQYLGEATPPLDRLERLLIASTWIGFALLTVGLFTGAIYTAISPPNSIAGLTIKVIWASIVWVWYLGILLARNVFDHRFSTIAKMNIVGFTLLLVMFFGLVKWGGLS